MIRERILAWLAWALVSIWSRTIRLRFLNGLPALPGSPEGGTFIYAFWHGNLFLLLHSHRGSGILIPASESRDGEIMARLLKHLGFGVVRGSSNRKGHKALRALIRGIRRGKSAAIAVDGPRGPLHKVKQGASFLAGTLKVPVVPVATAARRLWILEKSWDRLEVPVPFTRGLVLYGDPIMVNGTSDEEIAEGQRMLEAELQRLTRVAQAHARAIGSNARNDNLPVSDRPDRSWISAKKDKGLL